MPSGTGSVYSLFVLNIASKMFSFICIETWLFLTQFFATELAHQQADTRHASGCAASENNKWRCMFGENRLQAMMKAKAYALLASHSPRLGAIIDRCCKLTSDARVTTVLTI